MVTIDHPQFRDTFRRARNIRIEQVVSFEKVNFFVSFRELKTNRRINFLIILPNQSIQAFDRLRKQWKDVEDPMVRTCVLLHLKKKIEGDQGISG